MKILMVVTEGNLGGAQRHVLDISRELTRRGHQIIIAVGGIHTELVEAADSGLPKISVVRLRNVVRSVRFSDDIKALIELYRLIRRERPDVVHCHSSKVGVLASIAGRLAGARVVYTAHGFVFRENLGFLKRALYRWAEKFSSYFRNKIIAVSKSDADAARAAHVIAHKKIITIPNGIDVALADQLLTPEEARKKMGAWCGVDFSGADLVVSIANFYPVKNLPLLIRAFEFVVPRIPHARLVLIGEGEQRAMCERLVSENHTLQGKVFFAGKRPDAFEILRGADLVCLSSTKEGMPYVVLEAQLAGTPVVATRVGGVPEMGEGENLKLVVPHSAEIFSDAIVEMLRRDKNGSEKTAHKLFTLREMVDAIEAVYQSL
ncbi:MAG: glycosyltransferase [Candidatus Magasanikbacteria bacterium]|nr:glycosyltransferase [Candidatus Magasanikbacteria bacterium]